MFEITYNGIETGEITYPFQKTQFRRVMLKRVIPVKISLATTCSLSVNIKKDNYTKARADEGHERAEGFLVQQVR